ncbi:MAG: twin-arginine translocase TatA/TatE family subunit [Actinomycetota bacterium]|nr:twin-arginine translocase TatA/TatE family subunit [Actinomycetota bacterium]
MIASGIGPTEIGLILLAVLLLFGGSQLPKLAKNLGKAQKEFKDGLADGQKEADKAKESVKSDDSDS